MICSLCPRNCGIDRSSSTGYCCCDKTVRTARIALHHYEEPPLSGTRGSGAVFFTGCNMKCFFCQNHLLRSGLLGTEQSPASLAEAYLKLQSSGAHNINLVTPAQHLPVIRASLEIAKSNGLFIPVVYNTNAYEKPSMLATLEGLVDIYLPDFKYASEDLSVRFSDAPRYFDIASDAISEMFRQVGTLSLNHEEIAERGLIVRHMILPGCVHDSKQILLRLKDIIGTDCHISIMSQFTPTSACIGTPLNRKITRREYDRVIDYALGLGFNNIFMQDISSATLDFTPPFFTDE